MSSNIYNNSNVVTTALDGSQISYELQQAPYSIPSGAFPMTLDASANNNPATSFSVTLTFQPAFNITPYDSTIDGYFSTYTFLQVPYTQFSNSGAFGTVTTITAGQSTDRTYSIPDVANDIFMFLNAAQTITNKTINGTMNTFQQIPGSALQVGSNPIVVGSGGTGQTAFTANAVLLGNGTAAITANQVILGNVIDADSVQSMANKIIDGACNTITNVSITAISGVLPVLHGGTGYSSITVNGVLVGNASSTPSIQVLAGAILDSDSIQSMANKIIDGNCNTITNVNVTALTGVLPVLQGGTGYSSITLNGVLIGNGTANPSIQVLAGGILDSDSIQSMANKIIDGACNTITNVSITMVSGVLPVLHGGTGYSSITVNGVLIGNASSTPSIQVLTGAILDSDSIQSMANKIIDGNCNTITNVNVTSLTGVLPVLQGGTGYSSITLNGILIGNGTATPSIQVLTGAILDSDSIQSMANKIIDGNCNTITNVNITAVSGILPVINGGTGYSSITLNGVLIGNGTANPAIQVLTGAILDSDSIQSMANKIIDGNCNTITNVNITAVSGVLPVIHGGTGYSSITVNGVLIGNGTANPSIQVLTGAILDSDSIQSMANKIIDGNCNTITNVNITAVSGILPVIHGGTGYSSILLNSLLIGNITSTPTLQTLSGAVLDSNSVQSMANKIIDGNCNTITNVNITAVSGVLPVIHGGTGYSSITVNGVLIGNGTATPSIQVLTGAILDSDSIQSMANKIIDGNCNTITNVNITAVSGVLPVIHGGTGYSSITVNGVLIGNGTANPSIQVLTGAILDSDSIQSMANKIIDGNCNTITNVNITAVSGILPVIHGGTGYSSILLNSLLIGNITSTPTLQTLSGAVLDSNSVQSMANKIIDGNCNTITNVNITAVSGVLPVIHGGTGYSSITVNGVLIGNGTANPSIQVLTGAILDSDSIQSMANKIIDGNCNTITNVNITAVSGILPVIHGGTGYSSILLNSLLIGNITSTPTLQTLSGAVLDSNSVQSMANKIIDGNCNTITNVNITAVSGVLPVIHGGTGYSSITVNGVLIGNGTANPSIQVLTGAILDSDSIQSMANKIIDGNCNTITNVNITAVSGILPVIHGGTGYSSILLNSLLIGNITSTPTLQTLSGAVLDSNSNQSMANKIIDGNCNTITNVNITAVSGVLPVIHGGTGYSSITVNGVLIGNGTANPSIQVLTGAILDSDSIQSMANKIIDGNCNTITNVNITAVSGILPVIHGGTGYSSILLNSLLIGNITSTPTLQTLSGAVLDSNSVQSMANKIINGACNTITNINISSLTGVLPVVNGGTGYSSILLNSLLIGNLTSTPTLQTLSGAVLDSNSTQSMANKIIDGNCNTITNVNITAVSGILPVIHGGTGYSSILLHGVLIGNVTSTPTIQTLSGAILDSNSIQSMANKIIDGNCNTITNINITAVSGVLPVVNGGTGYSSITLNGVLIGNASSTPTIQTLSGVLVDTLSTQSINNKILTNSSNTIAAKQLLYQNGGGTNFVDVFTGNSAPVTSQVLTASSSSAATWQYPFGAFYATGNSNNTQTTTSTTFTTYITLTTPSVPAGTYRVGAYFIWGYGNASANDLFQARLRQGASTILFTFAVAPVSANAGYRDITSAFENVTTATTGTITFTLEFSTSTNGITATMYQARIEFYLI